MLENIKSIKILKQLFNLIYDERKLKIIKYNKQIQNKLNINHINYQLFSGRYLIPEKNGIIKEFSYYNNNLIYEGEYLNGKRNGNGKEYNEYSELLFEGKYLYGERLI